MTPGLTLLLLLAHPAASAETLDSLGHAPPAMVSRLSRECIGLDRVRITALSTRYETRVGRMDERGLGGFTPRGSSPKPPDPMLWPSIERIDAVHSRFHLGMGVGIISGGLIGLPLGFNATGVKGLGVWMLCAGVGGWLGGRIGSALVHEENVYEAGQRPSPQAPPPPAAAGAPATGAAAAGAAATPAAVPATGSVTPTAALAPETSSPRAESASAKIKPGDLLLVDFTDRPRMEGFASRADAAGLHGLRPSLASGPVASLPDVVPWSRIESVDKRGNSAGRGALVGGLGLGLMGAVVGAAAGGGLGGTNSDAAVGAGVCAAVGGAIGAGLGALIGAPIPRWHNVY